ncbi:Transcriptional regulator [Bifidobacterium actinocoloniiforme DSM 22766]|uniref:Transcriptional regulator n=1 Tax=Bifidobacterium actinocoloniiforme DSM 22766 TaxID=1437605 RepID=A0A086YYN4_9BIFI|nr:GntR family transcriptional regulator [Bifidobacterium actinocoloniiforme]AKV55907.1 GntR family transcriptional regulator [Bifidobacterium actinocoloniiforme DSM 22766]KFI39384.1 Transcriptional regulator [Bifidobacterium actinocoloniiforme DSM 22766]
MDPVAAMVAKNMLPSRERTIGETIYQALRRTIVLGEIPRGCRINEKIMAEALNISRTPIRHAVERLDQEGLVERRSGVGVVVRGISIKDAHEIFQIRQELDSLATVRAMDLMGPTQFVELKAALEQTDRLDAAGKVVEVTRKFTEFNDFIYDASKMPRLKIIINRLKNYLVYFRDISVNGDDRRQLAIKEHWLIYQGMAAGDHEQVERIVHTHLDHSLDFILKVMRSRNIA